MKIKQDISIGQNLARLRAISGHTQEQLANEMQLYGCSTTRNTYAQMEGGTYNIRISELLVLKEIHQCELSDFFVNLPIPVKFGTSDIKNN